MLVERRERVDRELRRELQLPTARKAEVDPQQLRDALDAGAFLFGVHPLTRNGLFVLPTLPAVFLRYAGVRSIGSESGRLPSFGSSPGARRWAYEPSSCA